MVDNASSSTAAPVLPPPVVDPNTTTPPPTTTPVDPAAPVDTTTPPPEGEPPPATPPATEPPPEPYTPPPTSTTYTSSTSNTGEAYDMSSGNTVVVDEHLYDQIMAELANQQQSFVGEDQLPAASQLLTDTLQSQQATISTQQKEANQQAENKDKKKTEEEAKQQIQARQLTRTPQQIRALAMQLAKENPELKDGFSLIVRFSNAKIQEKAVDLGRQADKTKAAFADLLKSGKPAAPLTNVVAKAATPDGKEAPLTTAERAVIEETVEAVPGDFEMTEEQLAKYKDTKTKGTPKGSLAELEKQQKELAKLAKPTESKFKETVQAFVAAGKLTAEQAEKAVKNMREGAQAVFGAVKKGAQTIQGRVAALAGQHDQDQDGSGQSGGQGGNQATLSQAWSTEFYSVQEGRPLQKLTQNFGAVLTSVPAIIIAGGEKALEELKKIGGQLNKLEHHMASVFHFDIKPGQITSEHPQHWLARRQAAKDENVKLALDFHEDDVNKKA